VVQFSGSTIIIISGVPALAKTTFGVEADQINIRTLLAQMEDELSLAADAVSEQSSCGCGTRKR
jgi:hypothetical protein